MNKKYVEHKHTLTEYLKITFQTELSKKVIFLF